MSFKREGNDSGLLANLRRRRVKELFTEEIPEDEAKLLCNGRFACLVCQHNPVFDTVNMLMVHRQGKKHATAEAEFVRKKKELRALILKRKHEQFMKDGTTNIRQAPSTSSHGIRVTQPYDPRTKKHNLKPYDRKPRLNLLQSDTVESPESKPPSASRVASASCAFTGAVPSRHSHQLKNIFAPPQKPQVAFQPYRSQRTPNTNTNTSLPASGSWQIDTDNSNAASASVGLEQSSSRLSSAQYSSGCSRDGGDQRADFGRTRYSSSANVASCDGETVASCDGETVASCDGETVASCDGETVMSLERDVSVSGESRVQTEVDHAVGSGEVLVNCDRKHGGETTGRGGSVAAQTFSDSETEKKQLAKKYLHIRGSGWKKDWDGKWIRDEDAEFDSDEEPPDLP